MAHSSIHQSFQQPQSVGDIVSKILARISDGLSDIGARREVDRGFHFISRQRRGKQAEIREVALNQRTPLDGPAVSFT